MATIYKMCLILHNQTQAYQAVNKPQNIHTPFRFIQNKYFLCLHVKEKIA